MENSMEAVLNAKGAPAKTPEVGRQGRRHCQHCSTKEWRFDRKGCGEMVSRDAAGRRDAPKGQIHNLRPQREKVPKRHSQTSEMDESQPTRQSTRLLNAPASAITVFNHEPHALQSLFSCRNASRPAFSSIARR